MNEQINNLEKRVKFLEDQLVSRSISVGFVETLRDTVFPDVDTQTARSQVTGLTTPKVPDLMIRAYIKGRIINIPAFYLT